MKLRCAITTDYLFQFINDRLDKLKQNNTNNIFNKERLLI